MLNGFENLNSNFDFVKNLDVDLNLLYKLFIIIELIIKEKLFLLGLDMFLNIKEENMI